MRTKRQIVDRLLEIEKDERLHYKAATVWSNAQLALIQMALWTEANTLRWTLRIPKARYYGNQDYKDHQP